MALSLDDAQFVYVGWYPGRELYGPVYMILK